jgi:hypothetical protein
LRRTLSLPPGKLESLRSLLRSWKNVHKAKKVSIQSLIGKLNWASRVIIDGRTFLQNIINLLQKANESHHHIRISKAARADISWWAGALDVFHGFSPFVCDIPLPSFSFASDACLSGGGAHFKHDWVYFKWAVDFPEYANAHINVLELITVLESAKRWGYLWEGLHIRVVSDNSATVAAINKGTSRSTGLMLLVHELFWLSVRHSFKLSASFIPGIDNVLADRISRLDNLQEACEARLLLASFTPSVVFCALHMSPMAFLSLQDTWSRG